jgi:hypothetical protein
VGFAFFILGIFIYNEIIIVPLVKAIWFSLKTGECCPMCLWCPSAQSPSRPIQNDSGLISDAVMHYSKNDLPKAPTIKDGTVKAPQGFEKV